MEYARSLHGQRTVQNHPKIRAGFDQFFLPDQPQKVEHLLRAADRKGRDHHVAAPVKRSLYDIGQFHHIVRLLSRMQSVAVGRLHHHIIRLIGIFGILDDRLILIADISGEYDLALLVTLLKPHFNGC